MSGAPKTGLVPVRLALFVPTPVASGFISDEEMEGDTRESIQALLNMVSIHLRWQWERDPLRRGYSLIGVADLHHEAWAPNGEVQLPQEAKPKKWR